MRLKKDGSCRPFRVSKKWLNATFSNFLIRCLRLRCGQHLMQGKPCCARAFADLPRMSPNPNKAIRGCGPLSTPEFFGRLRTAFAVLLIYAEISSRFAPVPSLSQTYTFSSGTSAPFALDTVKWKPSTSHLNVVMVPSSLVTVDTHTLS